MRIFDNPHYYKILEVDETASQKEISAAYRRLAKEYHPDRIPSHLYRLRQEAQEKLKLINEAYQALSDPEKRRQYDAYLKLLWEKEAQESTEYRARDASTEEESDATERSWENKFYNQNQGFSSGGRKESEQSQSPTVGEVPPRFSKKKKIIVYGTTGLVFIIGAGVLTWLKEFSGFSFTFITGILIAAFIGAMVGLVNALIKEKLS